MEKLQGDIEHPTLEYAGPYAPPERSWFMTPRGSAAIVVSAGIVVLSMGWIAFFFEPGHRFVGLVMLITSTFDLVLGSVILLSKRFRHKGKSSIGKPQAVSQNVKISH